MSRSAGNLAVDAQARYLFIRREIERHLPAGSRILELGAAPGDQIAALATAGYATTAVDIGIASDEWADGREGRMNDLFVDAGVRTVLWDLEKHPYPLEDNQYDGVIMTEVFEHLRDYPVRAILEAHRILKPGGYLFFTTPNATSLMNRIRFLFGKNVATPLPDWIDGIPFARHAREYTFPEVHYIMGLCGFSVELSVSRHFHIDSGKTSFASQVMKMGLNRIARLRPTLGPMIVIVGQKTTARREE